MSLLAPVRVGVQPHQVIKDIGESYEALVGLLESTEYFMGVLDIYTMFPPPAAVRDIIVKIVVELLSTIAIMTKQIKQR